MEESTDSNNSDEQKYLLYKKNLSKTKKMHSNKDCMVPRRTSLSANYILKHKKKTQNSDTRPNTHTRNWNI